MLSPEQNFNQLSQETLIKAYMAEIKPLDRVSKLPFFNQILENIENYDEFIRTCKDIVDPINDVEKLSNGTRVIKISGMPARVKELFYTAHVAACCMLLEDSKINLGRLLSRENYLIPERQLFLNNPALQSPDQIRIMSNRLNSTDTVRTIQLLRFYGLIKRDSDEMHQLGLGAASGTRDCFYVHFTPTLIEQKTLDGKVLLFGHKIQNPAEVIINDLDPRHEEQYKRLNDNATINAKGFIGSAMEVLRDLKAANVERRNLITLMRIEPAMIPDVKEFLRNLFPIVSDSCDFVLSIGAGDTPGEYKKRIDVVSEMFKQLERANLKPVLFQLHKGGNVMKQATSLQFGSGWASSYEILYCNINHDALEACFSGE